MLLLHDRDQIEQCLTKDPILHLYELGDLDLLYWPRTTWYASDDLSALLLVYAAFPPALLAMSSSPQARELLAQALPQLPRAFHAQISADLVEVLRGGYHLENQVTTLRMALADPNCLPEEDPEVQILGPERVLEIQDFYDESYPDNWFDPAMLVTERYLGIRVEGRLACVAGIHVWSPRYRVAALGNIATHPDFRGQGLARRVVGTLCRRLLPEVDQIGLNVRASNASAIRCYRALGFELKASFQELDARATSD